MKKIDYTAINWQTLSTFLAILEESSVSRAAERLGVTQSTVSHTLAKMRTFFGDPLFVRSGQSLVPTERALGLRDPMQQLLEDLEELTHHRAFAPRAEEMFFIVAANDMQRDLIFPQLLRDLRVEGISVSFEFIPSGHPTAAMMRDARCHLALTPFPPDSSDISQKLLLTGRMMCFFDGSMRDAPATWEEYCAADHLAVRFPDGGTSLRALTGVDKSSISKPMISVPNFNAIPAFIQATTLLATEMNLMKLSTLSSLNMAPLPVESEPVKIYMTWHQCSTNDPAHIWLRERIERIAEKVSPR